MLNTLKIEESIDPKRWEVLNKTANAQQVVFTLGHLNPEVFMDLEKGQRNKILKTEVRGNTTETTKTYGIITKKGKRADYYGAMTTAIQAGLISKLSIKDIQGMRDKANKILSEKYDFNTDINLINYKEEKNSRLGIN